MRGFKIICGNGGEQNSGDLDQSVKKFSDFYTLFLIKDGVLNVRAILNLLL